MDWDVSGDIYWNRYGTESLLFLLLLLLLLFSTHTCIITLVVEAKISLKCKISAITNSSLITPFSMFYVAHKLSRNTYQWRPFCRGIVVWPLDSHAEGPSSNPTRPSDGKRAYLQNVHVEKNHFKVWAFPFFQQKTFGCWILFHKLNCH